MLTGLMASAITFKKCTWLKLSFVLLNLLDMGLTIYASSIGAHELNPILRGMFAVPFQLYLVKIMIPVLLAWLLPGKILIPSIGILALVTGWNIKELLVLYF